MIATVKFSFKDGKTGTRYFTGDVVEIAEDDFNRITKQGSFLVEGNHRFGNGVCHPCRAAKPKVNLRGKTTRRKK